MIEDGEGGGRRPGNEILTEARRKVLQLFLNPLEVEQRSKMGRVAGLQAFRGSKHFDGPEESLPFKLF